MRPTPPSRIVYASGSKERADPARSGDICGRWPTAVLSTIYAWRREYAPADASGHCRSEPLAPSDIRHIRHIERATRL